MDAAKHSMSSVPVSVSPREKFEEFLRTRSMRLTPERERILEEVFSDHEHFDAEELVERLTAKNTNRRVSRATIYRTLSYMEDAGLLRKVARTNDREVYEHDYGYPSHDHLICKQCGKMIEFHNDRVTTILEEVAREHGFLLDSHRLEAHGLCEECRGPTRREKKLQLI